MRGVFGLNPRATAFHLFLMSRKLTYGLDVVVGLRNSCDFYISFLELYVKNIELIVS